MKGRDFCKYLKAKAKRRKQDCCNNAGTNKVLWEHRGGVGIGIDPEGLISEDFVIE